MTMQISLIISNSFTHVGK